MTLLLSTPAAARRKEGGQRRRRGGSLLPTAALLATGGDERISLGGIGSTNRYGCATTPDPALAPFGSSTASTISAAAFAAAAALRDRLAEAAAFTHPAGIYAEELSRMRRELAALCAIAEGDGVEMIFAPSGTDLHMIAAQLAAAVGGDVLAVMVAAAETGSLVPKALAGRHFAASTARGEWVATGEAIGPNLIDVAEIAVRDGTGAALPGAVVDDAVEALVTRAAAAGRHVLLTLADVSKTGLVAPSPDCAMALRDRFPGQMTLLVDAAQFRLAPATLRAYLEHGFMVALTGSKFVTGPAFSGVLLVPARIAAGLKHALIPGLDGYAARAELPSGWAAAATLPAVANPGLLLRWEAALCELRRLRSVPEGEVVRMLAEFAAAVAARLTCDPAFAVLPTPVPERGSLAASSGWDAIPTIFPFLLRDIRTGELLDRAATERVYRQLRPDAAAASGLTPGDLRHDVAARRCEIGQPVACGAAKSRPISALRLCASARLVVEAADSGIAGIVEQAMAVLDKVALMASIGSAR